MKHRKASGLKKRWLQNNVSIMLGLVVMTVLIFGIFVGLYFYSSLSAGLRAKAKTTTDFFGNYISQSYNDYYQSCMKFAQSFEESGRLELQFVSASGRLVASSSGPWMGQIQKTPDLLQAVDISCFSLLNVCNSLKGLFAEDASIVTMSISTTRMASENYGYMGPIKAALDSSVAFLAKSLSQEISPNIRVNAVGAGLLKTSASAGIPGYIDAYLFAEQVIPRRRALETDEPAQVLAFLLSPRSSGINAQTIVVDAGMSINYFDRGIVRKATAPTNS